MVTRYVIMDCKHLMFLNAKTTDCGLLLLQQAEHLGQKVHSNTSRVINRSKYANL